MSMNTYWILNSGSLLHRDVHFRSIRVYFHRVTVSNHSDYNDLETKTCITMEAEEYIFGSNCHYNGKWMHSL